MNWYIQVLKNYAKFDGRARRKEYWMFTLVSAVIFVALSVFDSALGLVTPSGFGVLSSVYFVATLIPSLAVGARRLHDTNRSAWWLLISAIPLVSIVLLVFMCLDSQKETNKYGEVVK